MLKISDFVVHNVFGYELSSERHGKDLKRSLICIIELALCIAYCFISIHTFRTVEPPVMMLSFIWVIQIIVSLYKQYKEEKHRIQYLVQVNGFDDSKKVRVPSVMRIFLFFVFLVLSFVIIAWHLTGTEMGFSLFPVRDVVCIVIYIFALTEQTIELLIQFSEAVVGVPTNVLTK